jgi:membrane protease YdiL (CAAX protease family)
VTDAQSTTRTCPNCGSQVEPWVRFCQSCGAAQPDPAPLPEWAPPEDRRPPIRAWEPIVVLLIAVLTQGLATIPALFLFRDNRNAVVAMSLIVGELAMLGVVVAWIKGVHRMRMSDFGWRTRSARSDTAVGLGAALLGLILEIPLLAVGQLIGRLILGRPVEAPQQIAFEGHPSVLVLVFTGIGAVILAPIAEESLFRGIVYQGFRSRMSVITAGVLSGVLFGLVHVYPLLWLPIGALGYILAMALERRGSLLPCIVGHALFNTVGYVVFVISALN